MDNVLILDVETTGLDPKVDRIIELGWVLWSVRHKSIVECRSVVLASDDNPAEPYNRLPAVLCKEEGISVTDFINVEAELLDLAARRSDVVVGHCCSFDYRFLSYVVSNLRILTMTWIDTDEDFPWPKTPPSRSLVNLALENGVTVTNAHRAIHDCLLLARMFEGLPDAWLGMAFVEAEKRARREKSEFIARIPYEQNEVAKRHGFRFNGAVWRRTMAVEDAAKLPFEVVDARELSP